MNLISGTHHSYERREYAFIILREYIIISLISNPNEIEMRETRLTMRLPREREECFGIMGLKLMNI